MGTTVETTTAKHLLSDDYTPNSIPGVLYILFLIPIVLLRSGYYSPHFRRKEIEVLRFGDLPKMTHPVSSRTRY